MDSAILDKIPILRSAGEKPRTEFLNIAVLQRFETGKLLALEGNEAPYFFVVLSGRIRVYKIGDNGREVTLYYINETESCFLTSFSILSHNGFPAHAIVEEEVELAMVPAEYLRDWVSRFEIWQQHLFGILSTRLGEILHTIDQIAFQKLDAKIAEKLIASTSAGTPIVTTTHEKLASEIGSTRVAVSRVLEQFKNEGLLSLGRGKITVEDKAGLRRKLNG